jgi:acid phosphatase family membrane protein YuiD
MLISPVFLSAIASLFAAQLLKVVINLFKYRSRSFKDVVLTLLWKTGGMPSSHSSLAVSICTSIGFVEGADSSLFILSLFFALVIIRDAMGVRRSSGLQARALNAISRELAKRFDLAVPTVKEVHGHTFPQVFFGSLLGFFLGLAFCVL